MWMRVFVLFLYELALFLFFVNLKFEQCRRRVAAPSTAVWPDLLALVQTRLAYSIDVALQMGGHPVAGVVELQMQT